MFGGEVIEKEKCPNCGASPCVESFDILHIGEWFCGSYFLKDGNIYRSDECRTVRKRDVHFLDNDGMVMCNHRDKEASHRAAMGDILTSSDSKVVTCNKCLSIFYKKKKQSI